MDSTQRSRLFSLPLVGSFLTRLESDGAQYGWPEAVRRAGKHLRTTVETANTPIKTLTQRPVLLIGNHPFELEVLALLASIPARDDLYIVANANITTIIPAANKHIVPVHISHNQSGMYDHTWLRRRLDRFHTFLDPIPKDQAQEMNRESISNAAKRISESGLVMIFPDRHSPDGHWFNGVGYLTSQIDTIINPYVVFSFIEGTSSRDMLRIFPIVRNLLPQLKVTFSDPIELNGLIDLPAKEITKELEKRYREWCKEIGKKYVING